MYGKDKQRGRKGKYTHVDHASWLQSTILRISKRTYYVIVMDWKTDIYGFVKQRQREDKPQGEMSSQMKHGTWNTPMHADAVPKET
jgi:hypothetical protein